MGRSVVGVSVSPSQGRAPNCGPLGLMNGDGESRVGLTSPLVLQGSKEGTEVSRRRPGTFKKMQGGGGMLLMLLPPPSVYGRDKMPLLPRDVQKEKRGRKKK